MKCSACGDRAISPGPKGTYACRTCMRLLRFKRVKWEDVARIPGKPPGGEGMNPDYWDDSRSGRDVFFDAMEELKRIDHQ